MRYDDTFVLLAPGRAPEIFAGATHAYQATSKEAPNGNVGSIRPGTYFLKFRREDPLEFFLLLPDRKTGDIPAYRDTDRDSFISAQEMEQSLNATKGPQVAPGVGMVANAVLFHPGYDDPQHPRSSIACQTASRERVLGLRQAGRELDYVLR